jgi:IclR family KDG regulon transcriptional repressor
MSETRSLMRALNILDLFTIEKPELGVTEASENLGLSKGTVSRLMRTLESAGFLKKNEATRKFVLTGKFVKLSRISLSHTKLKTAAAPYLKELSKKTNELILIHIVVGDRRYCLDWIESSHPIRHVIEKDHVYAPLHAGSAGKLLMAYLPDSRFEEILKKYGLPRYTDKTITDPVKFKQEIEKIRKLGMATSSGEIVSSALSVSVPVRNWGGEVIASLSLSWLAIGDPPHDVSSYPDLVKDAALRLSHDLGYLEKGEMLFTE